MKKKQQQPDQAGMLFGGTQQADIFYNSEISKSTLVHNTPTPKRKRIRVLSPDGFDIRMDKTWLTAVAAAEACKQWIEGFRQQGYYSTVRYGERERIPMDDIAKHCTFIHTDDTYPSEQDCDEIMRILGINPDEEE